MSDCAGYSVHYKLSLKIKRNQKAFKGNFFLEELVNIGSNFGGLNYQRKSSENHSWPIICLYENPQFDKQFENMETVIVYSDGKPTELSNLVNIKTDGKS